MSNNGLGNMTQVGNGGASAFSPFRLGEVKFFTGGAMPRLVDADGGEWLRTGSLYPYASKYSKLLKELPGLCVSQIPGAVTGYAVPSYGYGGKLLYFSGFYVWAGGGTGGNWIDIRYSAGLTFASSLSPTSFIQGIMNAIRVGAVLIALGVAQSGSYGCPFSNSLTAFVAPSTGIPANVNFAAGASNEVNLAVIVNSGVNSSNGSGIYTTTDGGNWTNRTGTGGTSGAIRAANWMPCASKFAFQIGAASGPTALNTTADGYTQAAATLPAGATFGASDTWGYRYAASPTASLWLLADGRILRTTDGATFTAINPTDSNGLLVTSGNAVMTYDPATSRFIIATGSLGATGFPAFIYSDDQGLSWNTSTCFEDLNFDTTNNFPARFMVLGAANGKLLGFASVGSSSNQVGRLYDMTGVGMRSPAYVGTYRPGTLTASGSLTSYQFVKVK